MSEKERMITEELVERKIAVYCNIGTTIAPEPFLSLLRVRSKPSSGGTYKTPEEAEAEEKARQSAAAPADNENEEDSTEERMTWQNGMVCGLAGRRVGVNGTLDLRGVPAEEVGAIERMEVNGMVLADEGNRGALASVHAAINGTLLIAPPNMRVMVQPELELSRASLEAMPAGQRLLLVGNVFISTEVPPALIEEKFDRLLIVGTVIMSEAVQGAILGKGEITGVSIPLPASVTQVVRSVGNTTWTASYLSRLPDGIAYVNIGNTIIPAPA